MEVGSSVSLVDLLPGASALPAELVGELDRESAVRDVAAGTVLLRQNAFGRRDVIGESCQIRL